MPTIKERILAITTLAPARVARNLDALAAGLNTAPPKVLSIRFVNAQTILSECADGANILASLDGASNTNNTVKYAMRTLVQDKGLNVGDPVIQSLFDTLATGLIPVLTKDQAAQLKALAMMSQVVTRGDVEAAMYNPDGTEK